MNLNQTQQYPLSVNGKVIQTKNSTGLSQPSTSLSLKKQPERDEVSFNSHLNVGVHLPKNITRSALLKYGAVAAAIAVPSTFIIKSVKNHRAEAKTDQAQGQGAQKPSGFVFNVAKAAK